MSILPGEEQEPVCHYPDWSHEYEVDLRTRCGCGTCSEWLAEKGSQCVDPCFPRLTEEEVDYGADLQASGEPDRLT
jgi:hypothetical protein